MTAYLPDDVCLQCATSRSAVKAEGLICGIVEGYEYQELSMEWPRHHWRDWSDAELRRGQISEHRWNRVRRMSFHELDWERIASICDREGHKASSDEYYPEGRCVRCYALLESALAENGGNK